MKTLRILGTFAFAGAMFMTSCSEPRMTAEEITAKATEEFSAMEADIKEKMAAACDATMEEKVAAMAKAIMAGEMNEETEMEETSEEATEATEKTDAQLIADKVSEMKMALEAKLQKECDDMIAEAAQKKAEEMKQAAASAKTTTKKKESNVKTSSRRKADAPQTEVKPEELKSSSRRR